MDAKIEKSENFAFRIVKLYKYLTETKRETVMSKQILRSGTSIGANIAESLFAESDSDFVHKLNISRKEASETRFWLKLLYKGEYITKEEYNSLKNDCTEIINILSSIILSTNSKLKH